MRDAPPRALPDRVARPAVRGVGEAAGGEAVTIIDDGGQPMRTQTRALSMLRAIEGDGSAWSIEFTHDARPASKARPRFDARRGAKPRVYTPEQSRAAEEHMAMSWRLTTKGVTQDGALAIACVFFRPNRQRIDVDNMVKLVLDAGTKARVWYDDCQVVCIVARVELDAESSRTEVALVPSKSTLNRDMYKSSQCPQCGKLSTRAVSDIVSAQKRANRVIAGGFCSDTCARASTLAMARCVHCGNEFKRRRAGQSLCSNKCKNENAPSRVKAMVMAGKKPAAPTCQKCGGRVSRREYLNCASCRTRGRKKGSKNRPKPVPDLTVEAIQQERPATPGEEQGQ